MRLIGEARHGIVRLRRKPGARDPARGHRLEDREASAAQQAVNQRGDEHGLAGARQAGHAEPHGRLEQAVAVFDQRLRGQARLFDDIGKDVRHPVVPAAHARAGRGSRPATDRDRPRMP